MLGRWRYFAGALAVILLSLAIAAWTKGGWLLLHWDEPVQRAVEDARSSRMTTVVKRISFLGSTMAVLSSVFSSPPCRGVAAAPWPRWSSSPRSAVR